MPLFIFCVVAAVVGGFLSGCAIKPPNDPICFTDAPKHANCAYMVTGNDFQVDNSGNNFTDHGRNWNYDQLIKNSLILPPDTWGDLKTFLLEYCQQNQNVCTYDQAKAAFIKFEKSLTRE